MQLQKIDKPFNFVIFGASGDLAKLKLFPALYELALQKRFTKKYSIFGYSRSKMTDEEFRKNVAESVKKHHGKVFNQKVLDDLLKHCFYHQGKYDEPKDYKALGQKLLSHHNDKKVENVAFYSVPPSVFQPITQNLAAMRSIVGKNMKIILEKPLGENEKTATELFHFISSFFDDDDVFLLDHYLGKTPVQSILPLRQINTLLNVLLKGRHIANIQINALETLDVGERVGYFDEVGIIKDMIQSHLLQILSLITMSLPIQNDHEAIKREKMHILSALRYGQKECAMVTGQYKSYQKLKGIQKNSKTPTFAALRCFIDLEAWHEVPIYIRTGKKLNHKHTYIVIEFKKPKLQKANKNIDANKLIIELAPSEKIQIHLLNAEGKSVGNAHEMITSESLACSGDDCLPEHGRLILDAFLGDHTQFVSFEEVIAMWRFVDRVLKRIQKDKMKPIAYDDGSKGPSEQNALTACDNFKWYDADNL